MFQIKQLYDLQELDSQISAGEKSLAEVRARLADDSALVAARERLERLGAELEEKAPERRQVESAVQRLDEKLKTVENRLYGGSVTSARELSASEEERNFLQGQRSAEEDRLLELMVAIEDLQSAHNEAQEHLPRLEAERAKEHAELLDTEKRLTRELDALGRAHEDMTPQIPPSALSVYDSLRRGRTGYAVAKVERGMCQGCRLTLPAGELQRARSSKGMVQCSSCRRILYVV